MTQTAEALYQFFSIFGLPVYEEDSVPTEARPPYITVRVVEPAWNDSAATYARVWDRGGTARIYGVVDQIRDAIGEGVCIPTDSGAVWIYMGQPFSQLMGFEGDPALKSVYLNLTLHALTD